MEFIKRLNLGWKNYLFAFVMAIFLTIFSPHLFIKTEFWQNNFPVPTQVDFTLHYNAENKNDLKISQKPRDISGTMSLSYAKGYKYQHWVTFTVPAFRKVFYYDLVLNNDCDAKIFIGTNSNMFEQIKIDGKVLKLGDKKNIIIPFKKGIVKHLEITTDQHRIPDKNIFRHFSWAAFSICLISYFLIFLILSDKFLNLTIQKIKDFILKHKVELVLFTVFVIFYSIENLYSILHLDQFNWRLLRGDAPYSIPQIMYGLTKRFHSYFFLPFYPIFDFLLILTKNINITLGIIWTALASFSVMFVYKSIKLITKKDIASVILALIFGVSWSQIHLSHDFDIYIITGFYLSILIYLVINELQTKEYNVKNMFLIILVTALSLGVTNPNIITALILISSIFIVKKDWKFISKFILLLLVFIALFTQLKGFTNHNESWSHLFYKNTQSQARRWVSEGFNISNNIKLFGRETLKFPVSLDNKVSIAFDITFFVILILSCSLIRKKSCEKYYFSNYICCVIALLYNFISNLIWCPGQGLLFSLNHFALWFVLLGYSLDIIDKTFKNKKLNISILSILSVFLFLMLFINHIENQKLTKKNVEKSPVEYNFLEIKR